MCGIAGYSGAFSPGLLETMCRSMAHRGPDASGQWHDGGVGLGHQRLSIIDLSPTGSQPMHDEHGPGVLSYNGEIYNYRELRAELAEQGAVFRGSSDTEVILKLYARDGEKMLCRLNGIFAFALWDRRRRRLLVARDGLGVKPLYYTRTHDGFAFASELKSLLHVPGLETRLDPAAAYDHLTYLWSPGARTMLAGVAKLEPGQAMWVEDGNVLRTWRYYDLPYAAAPEATPDYNQAVDQVRESLRTAVRRQLVADVPVGAFLSGGLDSSAVVALARQADPAAARDCFTISFKGGESAYEGFVSDLPYARRVARHLGVRLHEVSVGPEMIDELETMLWHLDEPQADPAPINSLFIARKARELGIKVLLSGTGGDDVFSGYRRHFALAQEQYWAWLPRPVRAAMRRMASGLPTSNSMTRRVRKAFQYADLCPDERIAGYFRWLDPDHARSLFQPDFIADANARRDGDPLLATLARRPDITEPLDRMLYLEAKHFLADHNLNYTDKTSMAHGVEVRVPLLDPDLLQLVANLPPSFKMSGRTGKRIFKTAMEPYLPREVIYRPKTGFGAPLRTWMQNELKPLVHEVLSEASLRNRGIFEPKNVWKLIENDRAGRVDAAYPIFAILCMELWCRLFLDGKGLNPSEIR